MIHGRDHKMTYSVVKDSLTAWGTIFNYSLVAFGLTAIFDQVTYAIPKERAEAQQRQLAGAYATILTNCLNERPQIVEGALVQCVVTEIRPTSRR